MASPKTETKETPQDTQEAPVVSGLLADMEIEDTLTIPMRGRKYDADVVAIRAELEKCIADGTVRVFKNVTDTARRDLLSRKVRSAGNMKNKPVIKVATRWDDSTGKLHWGPASVVETLSQKRAS